MPSRAMLGARNLPRLAIILGVALVLRPQVAHCELSLNCPGDLVVACDGTGNAADLAAWLNSFDATASAGCGMATGNLDPAPIDILDVVRQESFSDISAWTLNGTTAVLGNPIMEGGREVLRLTNSTGQSGSAFTTQPVGLAADASFAAFFTFRISNPVGTGDGDGIGADGLVFVLQSVANTAGGSGGGIGYQGIPRSVGVEFDTYDNGAWDDFLGNHAGINVGGNIDSVTTIPVTPRMNDGAIWHSWVDYDGATDLLEVRLSLTADRPAAPILTATIDVAAELGTTEAFVGFTSGTGAAGGNHDILSLFTYTFLPAGSGCAGPGGHAAVYTASDECGDSKQCEAVFVVQDAAGPTLTVEGMPCDSGELALSGSPTGWTGADVSLVASAADGCTGVELFENDRTPLGADASDHFPCGLSYVRFVAEDGCGNVSTCDVEVSVESATPLLQVGDALRLRKDPAGRPVLDWRGAGGLGPELRFIVLRGDDPDGQQGSAAGLLTTTTWTEVDPGRSMAFYDVRSVRCDGWFSVD